MEWSQDSCVNGSKEVSSLDEFSRQVIREGDIADWGAQCMHACVCVHVCVCVCLSRGRSWRFWLAASVPSRTKGGWQSIS